MASVAGKYACSFILWAASAIIMPSQAASDGQSPESTPESNSAKAPASSAPAPNDWEEYAISTDRNSVTPHPNVVPRGILQIENGLTLEKFHSRGSFTAPETAVRLGVLKTTELRFSAPGYLIARGTERIEGTTDITIGLKQEIDPPFLKKHGFDLGIIAGLSAPTGTANMSSKRVDPFVQTVAYQKIGQKWIIGTAHSIFMPSQLIAMGEDQLSRRRNAIYQPTLIIYRTRGPNIDLWAESASNIAAYGKTESIIDFGILYRPGKRHQLDFRFGFGFTDNAPRAFVGAGYSIALGRPR